jgi:hypothetical protein
MAHVVETAILQAVEGKTRAQQVARLKEWKKHFLAEGADKITVFEVGPGNMNGEWVFTIHHKSGAAYGAIHDKYYKSPKSHDSAMEKWTKTPTLKFTSYAVTFEVEEI